MTTKSQPFLTPSGPAVVAPGDERNAADQDKLAMEALFSALEERGVYRPKELTEFEVYARLETYAKQAGPHSGEKK